MQRGGEEKMDSFFYFIPDSVKKTGAFRPLFQDDQMLSNVLL